MEPRLRRRSAAQAAIAKLVISEGYVQTHLDAMHLAGVRGYIRGSAAEQRLRDSLSSTIYAGTSDIVRNMIARSLGVPVER